MAGFRHCAPAGATGAAFPPTGRVTVVSAAMPKMPKMPRGRSPALPLPRAYPGAAGWIGFAGASAEAVTALAAPPALAPEPGMAGEAAAPPLGALLCARGACVFGTDV